MGLVALCGILLPSGPAASASASATASASASASSNWDVMWKPKAKNLDVDVAIKERYDTILRRLTPAQRRHGAFSSEARALVAMARRFDIGLFIESGTANGVSTEIIARMLPNVDIHTIDRDTAYHLFEKTSERLHKCCANVVFHKKDSTKLIPSLLHAETRRTGIFIDGPKGNRAKTMAQQYMQQPHVKFVGIHDTAPFWRNMAPKAFGRYDQKLFDELGVSVLHTWDNTYRAKWKFLDELQLRDDHSKYHDYKAHYGNGLDVLFKEGPPRDEDSNSEHSL